MHFLFKVVMDLVVGLVVGVAIGNAQIAPLPTCEDFYEASCPIMEHNQVENGFSHTNTPDECQIKCRSNEECVFFTWYERQCFLLLSCDYLETCSCCISGPGSYPDISRCNIPCTTTKPPLPPATTITTTTTTTVKPKTTQDPGSCNDFHEASCPITDNNQVDHGFSHTNTAQACQMKCRSNEMCSYFTWFERQCYLLLSCDYTHECYCCISGPGGLPDVSMCEVPCTDPENPTTRPPPPTTTMTTKAPPTTTTITTRPPPPTTTMTTKAPPTTTTTRTPKPTTTHPPPPTTTTTHEPPPTTPSNNCDDFWMNQGVQCRTDKWNVIDEFKHVDRVQDCQALCQYYQECRFWAFYDRDHCALLKTCDSLEKCPGGDDRDDGCGDDKGFDGKRCPCWSGPALPDLDECT